MLMLVAFAGLFICGAEGVALGVQKRWRELAVAAVLLGFAMFTLIAGRLHWAAPVFVLQQLLRPFGEALFGFH